VAEEVERRTDRLAQLAEAKAVLEARAAEREALEKAAYEADTLTHLMKACLTDRRKLQR